MKTLKCADLSISCSFSVSGISANEVKDKMIEHITKIHPEFLGKTILDVRELRANMDHMLSGKLQKGDFVLTAQLSIEEQDKFRKSPEPDHLSSNIPKVPSIAVRKKIGEITKK